MQTFAHEMLREIYEQPEALRRTAALYLADKKLKPEVTSKLAKWTTPEGEVLIAASGSSRHAGWPGRSCLKICAACPSTSSTPANTAPAAAKIIAIPVCWCSLNRAKPLTRLLCLREARRRGEKTLAITNVD